MATTEQIRGTKVLPITETKVVFQVVRSKAIRTAMKAVAEEDGLKMKQLETYDTHKISNVGGVWKFEVKLQKPNKEISTKYVEVDTTSSNEAKIV